MVYYSQLGSEVAEAAILTMVKLPSCLKGLRFVNSKPFAVLEYDSGESSFYMLIKPMANMVVTKGRFHYWGDI